MVGEWREVDVEIWMLVGSRRDGLGLRRRGGRVLGSGGADGGVAL